MYEKPEFLKPGHHLAVAFREGPVFFRITGREIVTYEPYEVGKVSAGQTSDWFEPKNEYNDHILDPEQQRFILQAFVGVAPEVAEVYLRFPPQVDRFNLRGTRRVPGATKWLDGVTSPFEEPDAKSELITFQDLYPSFNVHNPDTDDIYAMLAFHVAKYTYRVVRDTKDIEALIDGKKKCKIYTFLEPYSAPQWLVKLVGSDLMNYAAKLWNERMGTGV